MSVWERLGDPETHARLLRHPYHRSVADAVRELVVDVRAIEDREGIRQPQENLLRRLVEAERHYSQQSRLAKRKQGDPLDLLFWRRACVQLRAIGDALAWKFLAYDRPRIVLLSRNQRPGLIVGKAGSEAEWQACEAHWEAGRPALLAGITNMITASDILVADGDTLLVNEVKRGRLKLKAAQRDRMRALSEQMNTARIRTPSGDTYLVQSDTRLASYWTGAESHIDDAIRLGVSTWVPTPGVAVMFVAPLDANYPSPEAINARFETVQIAAGIKMGPMTHRIVVQSYSYPYYPNTAAPIPILPIPESHAAMLLSGEVVFKVELSVDRIVTELERRGLHVEILLDEADMALKSRTPVLRWAGPGHHGMIHGGVVEQIGIELNDLSRWADAVSKARPPVTQGHVGMYLCLANEDEVWL